MKDKVFLVATDADFTVYVNAKDRDEAVKKANKYYRSMYGEERDDFEAYDLHAWIEKEGGVMEW